MQDAEAVTEVHRFGRQGNVPDASDVQFAVGMADEVSSCHLDGGVTGIYAMERLDPWGDASRPATTSAAQIETNRVHRKLVPWKELEVLLVLKCEVLPGKIALVKRRPLLPKPLYN